MKRLLILILLLVSVNAYGDGFFGGGTCFSAGCGLTTASWATYFASTFLPMSGAYTAGHLLGMDATDTYIVDVGAPVTMGTGVATAAAINIGTAGSFVVSGGALGTPSSGNLSGCSGYPADATKANVPTVTVNSASIGALTGASNYVICTGACNFTPPAAVAGNRVCVRNAPNSTGAITINALASTYYEKHDYSNWNTVNKNLSSGGAQTDSICLFGYDSTHYIILDQVGTWSDGI